MIILNTMDNSKWTKATVFLRNFIHEAMPSVPCSKWTSRAKEKSNILLMLYKLKTIRHLQSIITCSQNNVLHWNMLKPYAAISWSIIQIPSVFCCQQTTEVGKLYALFVCFIKWMFIMTNKFCVWMKNSTKIRLWPTVFWFFILCILIQLPRLSFLST